LYPKAGVLIFLLGHRIQQSLDSISVASINNLRAGCADALSKRPLGAAGTLPTCEDAIRLANSDPTNPKTALALANAQMQIPAICGQLRNAELEHRKGRAAVLRTIGVLYSWSRSIVTAAVQAQTTAGAPAHNWVEALVQHLKHKVSTSHHAETIDTIYIRQFLQMPELSSELASIPFQYKLGRTCCKSDSQNQFASLRAMEAIERWLGIDTGPGPAIMATMLQSPFASMLFLTDKAWKCYENPYVHVTHANSAYYKNVKWTEYVLAEYDKAFQASALCNANSEVSCALDSLNRLFAMIATM
jgi:hypothetical protein